MAHPSSAARPMLHFTARANWLNDPNGIIFWKGRYHLFYQHNPHAPVWSRPHWGHASSTDLLSWTHQPIALYPDQFYDSAGCYSGCCVDDNGTATILYTAVRHDDEGRLVETVGLATGDDTLTTWTKHPRPVIEAPPAGHGASGFRDPFVWKHTDGTWRLILGSGTPERGAAVLLYGSSDLRTWTYRGVLLDQHDIAGSRADATLWECPQLVRLDGSEVLLLSRHDGSPREVVMVGGHLREDAFEPAYAVVMDEGTSWYAPHAFTAADGRPLVLGWLREHPEDTTQPQAGWAGALSLPRELYLDTRGVVATRPATEVLDLRPAELPAPTASGRYLLDLELPGAQAEVQVRLTRPGHLLPSSAPHTAISADADQLRVTVEWPVAPDPPARGEGVRAISGADPAEPSRDQRGSGSSSTTLRLIVDGAIVEMFVDSARASAFRAHPWHLRFRLLRLHTSEPGLGLAEVSMHRLQAPASPDAAPWYRTSQPDGPVAEDALETEETA